MRTNNWTSRITRSALIIAILIVWTATTGAMNSHASRSGRSSAEGMFSATIVTMDSIADAVIMEGYADRNLGDTIDIWVGYDDYLGPSGEITRGLVRFDLPAIPPGEEITSAKLRLYHENSWDYDGAYDTITAYGVEEGWQELTVTWNNAPAVGDMYGSVEVAYDPVYQWYELDVTGLVDGWITGSIPNYGIYLRGEEAAGDESSWRSFSSREAEGDESGYAPQLVIAYGSPASPTPTATATDTPTPTPSSTATNTLTPTHTPTLTSTLTPTVTHTSTPSPTATSTDTPSATATSTVTETPSSTPSPTVTATGVQWQRIPLPLVLRY